MRQSPASFEPESGTNSTAYVMSQLGGQEYSVHVDQVFLEEVDMRKFTLFLTAVTCLVFVAAANAEPRRDEGQDQRATVSYADLDLGTPAGVRTLRNRVKGAADRLCLQTGAVPLQQHLQQTRCLAAAMASGTAGLEQAVAQHPTQAAARARIELSAR